MITNTLYMKKYMPYVIFGVPALIGVLFLIKSIRNKKPQSETKIDETKPQNPQNSTTPTKPTTPTGTTWTQKDSLPFKKGNVSSYIGTIQRQLGITDDNKFGSQTQSKVIEFQKSRSLKADGIVGAITWKALFGTDFPTAGSGTSLVYAPLEPKEKTLEELLNPKF